MVRGTIVRYEPDLPVQYIGGEDRTVNVTRRLVQITVSVEILDQKQGKPLWQRSGLVLEGEYDSGPGARGAQEGARQAGDQHRGRSPVPMVSSAAADARGQHARLPRFGSCCSWARSTTGSTSAGSTGATIELLDDMRQQARLAGQLTDDVIQGHLAAQADSILGHDAQLPDRPRRRPSRITIQTEYTEPSTCRCFKHTFVLRPHAEEPL